MGHNLADMGGARHVGPAYACKLGNLVGDLLLGAHQAFPAVDNFAVAELDGPDFQDLIPVGVHPRGFKVERDVGTCHKWSVVGKVPGSRFQVVCHSNFEPGTWNPNCWSVVGSRQSAVNTLCFCPPGFSLAGWSYTGTSYPERAL